MPCSICCKLYCNTHVIFFWDVFSCPLLLLFKYKLWLPLECPKKSTYFINSEKADALVAGGFVEAGYATIHLDDCIVDKAGRDPNTNELRADPDRFPSGFKALGDYLHESTITYTNNI